MVFSIVDTVGVVRLALRMLAMRVVLRSSAVTTAMLGMPMVRRPRGACGKIAAILIVGRMGVVGLVLRSRPMGVVFRSSSMGVVI